MFATHSIKINGKWYKAGEEIPSADTFVKNESVAYSKSEINRMPVAELRTLAEKEKISGFKNKSGAELKRILIQKYGL